MSVRFERNAWLVVIHHKGQRIKRSCRTKEQALTLEQTMLEEMGLARVTPKPLKQGSMAQLKQICLAQDWHGKGKNLVSLANLVTQAVGPDTLARHITMQTLDQLVVDWRQQGQASATIRSKLSALRVMLTRAQRLGWISELPLFPEARTLRLPEPRDLVLADHWIEAMLDQLTRMEEREAARLVVLILDQALRAGEGRDLTWDRVDLAKGEVQLVGTKGLKPRRLPLTDRALAALRTQQEHTGPSGKVWTLSRTGLWSVYVKARDAVCQELGLDERTRKEWVVHTLRHTRLTQLAQLGWSAPQLQAWAGHSSLAVTQRYIHTSAVDFRALLSR